jgi:hypothetical protein
LTVADRQASINEPEASARDLPSQVWLASI